MQVCDLTEKTAIVTGGNGGIGLGIAQGLAHAGANIVIIGQNKAKNNAAMTKLQSSGAKVIALVADIKNKASINEVIKKTIKEFGNIDILINNAGTTVRTTPELMSESDWHMVLNTNLTGAFLCAQACYPIFKETGGGKILNNGSMMSLFGSPWSSAYGASKGGIVQLTRSLATAWAKDNIQVNCILPGWIDTDLTKKARASVPDLNEKVIARTPLGRWGTPDDLEGLAIFLSSAASNFVTGTAIPIDGGFSISI